MKVTTEIVNPEVLQIDHKEENGPGARIEAEPITKFNFTQQTLRLHPNAAKQCADR